MRAALHAWANLADTGGAASPGHLNFSPVGEAYVDDEVNLNVPGQDISIEADRPWPFERPRRRPVGAEDNDQGWLDIYTSAKVSIGGKYRGQLKDQVYLKQ
jgi:hypothetical protein